MPRSPQTSIDPEFWDRLRETLHSHMEETGLQQNELAPQLGIDPTTLNNFLNRDSKSLGGLAVALACTLVNLTCGDTKIGRIVQPSSDATSLHAILGAQLVLEFDDAFEYKPEAEGATIVLRRPPARDRSLRLAIRSIS